MSHLESLQKEVCHEAQYSGELEEVDKPQLQSSER